MQYQLEHHLFPTMPRYKYRKLVPLVRKFAEDNGIEYRATGQWEIIKDNIKLVRSCTRWLFIYLVYLFFSIDLVSCFCSVFLRFLLPLSLASCW